MLFLTKVIRDFLDGCQINLKVIKKHKRQQNKTLKKSKNEIGLKMLISEQ